VRRFLLALALLVAGCGSDDSASNDGGDLPPLTIPEGCNPLAADWDCMLPYPSDFLLKDDASMPSGKRVTLAPDMVLHGKTADIDPTLLHAADGFSPGNQILALFPGGVDDENLVFHQDDVTQSLGADSPTLLIDTSTGEPVLHFAELDPRADDDARRGLVIRPLTRLKDATRYVVVIRGLVDHDGKPVAPPEGFRRIRDKKVAKDPILGPLGQRYESEIFPVLEPLGVERKSLQLVWDFTTRTEENATGDMQRMRELLLAELAKGPPAFTIDDVQDDVDAHVFRKISGSMKVPLFLDANEPMSPLHRDANGQVASNGVIDVPFTVLVPRSVGERAAGEPPGRLVQYGHGFFGTRAEAESEPTELADEKGFVLVATDWQGMSEPDRGGVADALVADTANVARFTDRLHQGMANFMALAALAKGPLATAPELQVAAGAAYDPGELYFVGHSLGHILGSTYVALAPEVERAAMTVGGVNLSFCLFRAEPFQLFLVLLTATIPDFLDQQKFGYLLQLSFDRIDSITYASRMLDNTLPGSPPLRRVLLVVGIGDPAVTPLAAELQARSLGIPELSPAPRVVGGLETLAAPIDGSAFLELDFHVTPEPGVLAIPPGADPENPVHEGVRREPAIREAISRFLRPGGKIEQTCDGVCDPG
jgi:hypothetical protein